jgi:hypothetical protein
MRAAARGAPAGARLRGERAALQADPWRPIEEESIVCLLCGWRFRRLTNTHLRLHGTTPEAYKRRFGSNRRRSLMCGSLERLYAERAVQAGLASRIRRRPILVEPELRRRGGSRPIALEEWLTRREARGPASGRRARRACSSAVVAGRVARRVGLTP